MKTKTIASLALISTLLASPAFAVNPYATQQHKNGKNWPNWYIGLGVGGVFNTDGDVNVGGAAGVTGEVKTDTGYSLSLALGYAPATTMTFFQNTRWELEYTYRKNDLNSVGGVALSGEISSNSGFFNLYYDFNNTSKWTPYIGAGVGMTNVEGNYGAIVDFDDNVAAWQLMAGLAFAPETLPNTAWGLGYRYHDTFDDVKFTTPTGTPAAGIASSYEYSNHSVELGARFRF